MSPAPLRGLSEERGVQRDRNSLTPGDVVWVRLSNGLQREGFRLQLAVVIPSKIERTPVSGRRLHLVRKWKRASRTWTHPQLVNADDVQRRALPAELTAYAHALQQLPDGHRPQDGAR